MSVLALTVNSQVRMGYTSYEINKEFSGTYEIKSNYDSKGYLFYTIDFEHSNIFYFFGKNDKCTSCIILPSSQARVNGLSEEYNKKYTVITDSQWRAYLSGGAICNVYLKHDKDYGYFFLWE